MTISTSLRLVTINYASSDRTRSILATSTSPSLVTCLTAFDWCTAHAIHLLGSKPESIVMLVKVLFLVSTKRVPCEKSSEHCAFGCHLCAIRAIRDFTK